MPYFVYFCCNFHIILFFKVSTVGMSQFFLFYFHNVTLSVNYTSSDWTKIFSFRDFKYVLKSFYSLSKRTKICRDKKLKILNAHAEDSFCSKFSEQKGRVIGAQRQLKEILFAKAIIAQTRETSLLL